MNPYVHPEQWRFIYIVERPKVTTLDIERVQLINLLRAKAQETTKDGK